VKGFEAYVPGVAQNVEGDPVKYSDEKEGMYENRDNIIEENNICDTLESSSEQQYSTKVAFKESNGGKIQINANSELNLQILEMIEKSDSVWKCKVCGKTSKHKGTLKEHAESHIEGMSQEFLMLVISATKVFPIDIVYAIISMAITRNYSPVTYVESQV